jgi:hypothetical protein
VSSLILDLFFLVTLAQGAIRKWVAPGLSLEIEFFRDTLPVLALITCKPHVRRQLGRFSGRAATLLWAYASAAVFAAFSPGLPVFVVLVGIRTHFAYLPLALLMPIYLKSWTHGLRKFRQLLMLAVPILLLGLFQTTQPAGSVWNRYVDPEVAVATFGAGDSARATGTFAYITEFASFAEICAIITVLLILTSESNIVGRLWNAGLLIMALGAMMASGSRGVVAMFGAQVLGIAALGYSIRAIAMRHLLPFLAIVLLAAAASVMVLDRQAANFLLRAQDLGTSDTSERVGAGLFEWLEVMYQYPLGVGLGAGHQAFYAVMLDIGTPDLWEAELSRLAFELGLGVIFYIAFKVTLVGQLLARVKATRTRAGRLTLAMCITTLTPLIVTSSVYEPLTNAAFWAFVGVGFWVVKLKAAALLALPAAAPILERTVPAARTTSPIRVGAQ